MAEIVVCLSPFSTEFRQFNGGRRGKDIALGHVSAYD